MVQAENMVILLTGFRRLRYVIQVLHSSRAIVLVGIHRHQVPTGPYCCEKVKSASIQAVPEEGRLRGQTYKLYPTVEMNTGVPAETGNSL